MANFDIRGVELTGWKQSGRKGIRRQEKWMGKVNDGVKYEWIVAQEELDKF